MVCLVCGSDKTKFLNNIIGLDKRDYKIFNCLVCGSNFTPAPDNLKDAYNEVYNQDSFSDGYEKYFKIFSEIKKTEDPLKLLVKFQPLYLPVYKFLKDKKSLKILEIGCGLGYLTYALNLLGHQARGIDISEKSIELAKQNFGDYFDNLTIDGITDEKKFDLIVATELIEHLDSPIAFLEKCQKLLSDGGSIIFTTPNKGYYGNNYLWNTELPPLHLSWLEISGLSLISSEKFNFSSFNYLKNGVAWREKDNLLTDYALSRKISYHNFYPIKDNQSNIKNQASVLKRIFVDFYPIRLACNLLYALINARDLNKYVIASVILRKK